MTEAAEAKSRRVARIPTRERNPWLRLALVAAMVLSLWAVGTFTGLSDSLSQERVRDLALSSGAWGALIFVGAFALGQLMHLPGLLFIAAASFAWGPWMGGAMSALGASIAVTVNFVVVRRVGGGALAQLRRPVFERIIFSLHRRPKLTMFVARAVFITSPLLTTLLALSGVRLRDHTVTSAVGMVPLILGWSYFFHAAVF